MDQFLGHSIGITGAQTNAIIRVHWSHVAVQDLQALRAYIGERNPAAAQRVAQTIASNVNKFLSQNPELGRPGRVPGTREFVIPRTPFIVPYRVRHEAIQVLRVYHSARRWPEKLWPCLQHLTKLPKTSATVISPLRLSARFLGLPSAFGAVHTSRQKTKPRERI